MPLDRDPARADGVHRHLLGPELGGPEPDQAELRADQAARGIVIESYSPLKNGTALAQDPVVTRIAAAHGVAWNQVVLRWNLQLGTVVIPRSKDATRQAANLDLSGFELDDDEMAAISALRP